MTRLLIATLLAIATTTAATVVRTTSGSVQGHAANAAGTVEKFLGIPFALPPVGHRRFRSPQLYHPPPNAPVLNGSAFSPQCVQSKFGVVDPKGSEDCLYLNVWRPADAEPGQLLPVVIWIYGGSFMRGTASNTDYDPTRLVARHGNVIYVSLNYRVGPFGWAQIPLLSRTSPSGSSGNLGLEDQRLAMVWVRRNIAKFGGNPHHVTIQGESAGGISVCMHIVSPLSAGLFHQAISESGPCDSIASADQADAAGSAFIAKTNCSKLDKDADVVSCLQSLPVMDVYLAANTSGGIIDFGPTAFGPSVDGYNIPRQPFVMLAEDDFNKVPYLLGSNDNEMSIFTLGRPEWLGVNKDTWPTLAKELSNNDERIMAYYDPANLGGSYLESLILLISDRVFICGQRRLARHLSRVGQPVYYYSFNRAPANGIVQLHPFLGAFHFAEVPFVFGNVPQHQGLVTKFTADEAVLSQNMQDYWLRFASAGSPNSRVDGGTAPKLWPRYTYANDANINLDVKITESTKLYDEQCDLWDEQLERMFNTKLPVPTDNGGSCNCNPTPPPESTSKSGRGIASVALVFSLLAIIGVTYAVLSVRSLRRSSAAQSDLVAPGYISLGEPSRNH
eukprot:TRINITY_DN2343_c0_g1_i1.p1 TRINITY_DN2343_c0_g1~~TRINITY_DN2343_c0_g1_i1.p1  ORF type:complete len:617 (+),score=273.68 TRINITY_DN2343_c0_g1_i1:3-1853(+)